jgi:integrin beta 3
MLNLDDIADVVAAAVAPFQAQLAEQQKTIAGLRDLRGIADAVIDREGGLVLTFSDGRTKEMGRIVGKDGDHGATFTLDDFDIVQGDDGRTFKFCFTHGAEMHSFEFSFPVVLDRGVWKEGTYEHGDAVTWGGSLWIAQRSTDAKPDAADSGWRLAVKKGRDGRAAQ